MAKHLSISDYTYELPNEKIAYTPLLRREDSKLLVYSKSGLKESTYCNIADFLPEDTLILFNDTRVVEARVLFKKETGAQIEIFCLEASEIYADIVTGMSQKGQVRWNCLIGGAAKWKDGSILKKQVLIEESTITLEARLIEKKSDYYVVAFNWNEETICFAEILHQFGLMPLPPYIKRAVSIEDNERYQTIFAREKGSVAAPTAGLHFSATIMKSLEAKNIRQGFVTLHVGAGTFKPVQTDKMSEHEMHSEFIEISQELLLLLLTYEKEKIISTGTTTLRTLESIYWLGVKVHLNPQISASDLKVHQWDPYEIESTLDFHQSIQSLLNWMINNEKDRWLTTTQVLIAPGYEIRTAQRLVTNFHQPHSTLLLLVAAFIGEDWKGLYNYALEHNFRFLSYGDGCLLSRQ